MRFFIVFLLFYSFHCAAAETIVHAKVTVDKRSGKSSIHLLPIKVRASKAHHHSLNMGLYEQLDLIHQSTTPYSVLLFNAVNNSSLVSFLNFKELNVPIVAGVQFNYLFIFSFLYPKHTFW